MSLSRSHARYCSFQMISRSSASDRDRLNFLACNAPIKQLYNLGVEIEENSELDLFEAFNKHEGDERIPAVVAEMEAELGAGNKKPEVLAKLAQYELTLKDWVEAITKDTASMWRSPENAGLHSRHSSDLFLVMSTAV